MLPNDWHSSVNTLRPRQKDRHLEADIFKCIFLNENLSISLKISLNCAPKVRINNFPAMVWILAWRRPGDKPLSEPMMVTLLTHTCVTQPQWFDPVSYSSNSNLISRVRDFSLRNSYNDCITKITLVVIETMDLFRILKASFTWKHRAFNGTLTHW